VEDNRLKAAQQELMRHSWDTFVNDPPRPGVKGSVVPGCPTCRKIIYSDNQYLSHLAIDVLPGILEKAIEGGF
jgi:hypothetical protein